jgi:23S rRNA pseudouridine2605 synthase
MTTDGDLTQQLTHPKYGVSRVYHVRIPSAVSVTQLAQWRGGVASAGRPPMRVKVLQSSPSQTVLEVVALGYVQVGR